jgi:DNA invertase Pin-like site-specific DNA recombinase
MLAIYVRTSTTNNEDSIPAQEAACRAYAEQHGLEVEGVYADEGTSGGLGLHDRDALSEAVLAVEEGRAEGLLVHRLDRLARELHVQEATLSRVWQAGGRVYEATHGEVLHDDADDPMRTFVRQVMGAAAQLERGLINARMRGGRRRKKERGGYLGGLTVPVGKRVEGSGRDARLVDDEAGVRLREYARRLRRDERMSFNAIAQRLNEEQVPTPRGGRWHATTVQRLVVSG